MQYKGPLIVVKDCNHALTFMVICLGFNCYKTTAEIWN